MKVQEENPSVHLDELLVVLEEGAVPEAGPVRRLVPGAADRAGRARKEGRPRRRSPHRRLRQDDLGLLIGRHGRDHLASSPPRNGAQGDEEERVGEEEPMRKRRSRRRDRTEEGDDKK